MLLAYIDEIGEPGAYVGPDHPRFRTSPAFGYAGFVMPESAARGFGAKFTALKRQLFASEIDRAEHPGRWEFKGANLFRPDTPARFPQQLRVFDALVRSVVVDHGGKLFYYADEKQRGTPKQIGLDVEKREADAMRETLNRLARHAHHHGHNLMVIIDQINEKTRVERVASMYAHIFSRAGDFPEMRCIVEPPMHVDSSLSSNVQFADWVAAAVTRAVDHQLNDSSKYAWVTDPQRLASMRGSFTYESKLHLWNRGVQDINHSELFHRERRLAPTPHGQLLGASVDPAAAEKMAKIWRSGR